MSFSVALRSPGSRTLNRPRIAQMFDYYGEVSPEPLQHLAAVVEHEIARLQLEYLCYGLDLDLEAAVDSAAGTVVITGRGLGLCRTRKVLESRIGRAVLRMQTHAQGLRITVFPASSQAQESV